MTEVPESIPFQPGGCKIQAMGSGTVKERKKQWQVDKKDIKEKTTRIFNEKNVN
ncbi:hypothetical protein JCM19053_3765 [Vibrio sp. JCM 19053]|nr:hypothetical protein JCM19053_3765 [Vibrio sp. JCM 19053]